MMFDHHIVLCHQNLEKSGWPAACEVAQQWSTRVQAELPRNPIGQECPGGMNMAAAVQMRADRGQPASERFRID
jgi:hypothetical protein